MKAILQGFEKTGLTLDPARFFLIVSLILSVLYNYNASFLKFEPHEKGRFLHSVHLALNLVGITDHVPVSFVETLSQIDTPNDPTEAMAANACHWTSERNEKYCKPFPPGYKTPDFWHLASIPLNFHDMVYFESYLFAKHYTFIGYVFYAFGSGLGMLLGLPPIVIMYMAIGTNALMVLLLGYLTIKILPVLQWPVCYLLLLPKAFILRALVMPDAITIELCLLTVAIALHLLYRPRLLTKLEISGLVAIAFMTGFVKFAYFLVPLIYIIIPSSCFGSNRLKYAIVSLSVLASVGAGVGWAVYATEHYYAYELTSQSPGTAAPFEQKFETVFFHPLKSLELICATMSTSAWIFNVMENLMHRSNHIKLLICLIPLLVLTLPAEATQDKNTRFVRIVSLGIFAATIIILCIVMYFHREWALKDSPYLVQGRYILPVLPFLLLTIHSVFRLSPKAQAWVKTEGVWITMVWLVWLHWFQLRTILPGM
jgi:uncharacterized membrane protein